MFTSAAVAVFPDPYDDTASLIALRDPPARANAVSDLVSRTESNPIASICREIFGPCFATASANWFRTSVGFVLKSPESRSLVVPMRSAYDFSSGPPSRIDRFMSRRTLLNVFAARYPSSPRLLIAVDRPITAVWEIPTVDATGASALENAMTDGTDPPSFAVAPTTESDRASNWLAPLPIVLLSCSISVPITAADTPVAAPSFTNDVPKDAICRSDFTPAFISESTTSTA